MEPRHPQALDAGLFLVVVAVPLAVFPLARSPFADPKLVLLALGALLIWVSDPPVDRRLAAPAAGWVGANLVAAAAGVDPLESIVGLFASTGLIMLGAGAFLLATGPGVPGHVAERVRGWLVWTGLAVALIALVHRFAPGALDRVIPDLSFVGSTLGNPIFAAGFLAVGIAAALGEKDPNARRLVLVLIVLTSGLAVNGERSSLLLPVVAVAASRWFAGRAGAHIVLGGATVVAVLIGWAAVSPLLPTPSGLSSTVGQFETLTGERQRLAVYSADLRGFLGKPVLGWGPGNTWSAYVSSASSSEMATAGRGWGDAHDLPLQSLVTTGVIGTAALLFLALRAAPNLARRSTGAWWTQAAAATLLVFHLYEPLNLTLTPLMLLLLGMAGRDRAAVRDGAPPGSRPAAATSHGRRAALVLRPAVGLLLASAVAISGLVLVASAMEQWGRTHFAEWALRASLQVQPWRVTAAETLALNLALDGRAGDAAAAQEARDLIGDTVRDHPWNPGVRLIAAGVEQLLRNLPGAQSWIRRQLDRFPHDTVKIPTGEPPPPTASPGGGSSSGSSS